MQMTGKRKDGGNAVRTSRDSSDIGKKIGRIIASRRVLLGLSVAQCAKEAGVSRQAWGQWEAVGAKHIATLDVVAKVLGVTVSDIVSVMEEDPPLPPISADAIVEGAV